MVKIALKLDLHGVHIDYVYDIILYVSELPVLIALKEGCWSKHRDCNRHTTERFHCPTVAVLEKIYCIVCRD